MAAANNDTFSKLKASVNRGITTISVKTASSLEKSKIKTHMETLSRELERDLLQIGEAAYRLWESGSWDCSTLDARFAQIKEKRAKVEELQQQMDDIDVRDSEILGTKAAEQQEEPKYICANCGSQYDKPVNFCRKCGNKMA